jgi:DUF438 domain-containing protein
VRQESRVDRAAEGTPPMSELIDNRAHRIRILKDIIQELHRGADPDAVRGALRTIVRETSSSEIAAMEQELIAGGMPVEEVQSMCDLHSQVLREILVEPVPLPPLPGHPLDTFERENEAIAGVVGELRELARGRELPPDLAAWRNAYSRLADIEKHYQRKENLLFSCLERHGISGPSKVMWGKDDEVRALLSALGETLAVDAMSADEAALVIDTVLEPCLAAIEEMIVKERRILLPMSRETLTDDEWAEIWQESPRYGYCLVEPRQGYRPPPATAPERVAELSRDQAVVFPTGALSFEQLRGILGALPVDITFVDADDRVRYFSEGADRVFERSKAILGREVRHCHPPKSVHVVEEIVGSFRSGRQDVAEFWIQLKERFVHIRYFAVRDAEGGYLGTLEVTQDLTRLRGLEGERRLLQWAGGPA